jgi:hypothetical protein
LIPYKGKSNFLFWIQVAITEQAVSFLYLFKGSLGPQTPSQQS